MMYLIFSVLVLILYLVFWVQYKDCYDWLLKMEYEQGLMKTKVLELGKDVAKLECDLEDLF